jgi:hypothetical protein
MLNATLGALLMLSSLIPVSSAFTVGLSNTFSTPRHSQAVAPSRLFASTEEESMTINNSADTDKASNGVVEGTEEELMYALGVNLARQLGDVRPRKYDVWSNRKLMPMHFCLHHFV